MRSNLAGVLWLVVAVVATVGPARAEPFEHPRYRYTISIPAGARLASPPDADELVIHSWAGFIVSLRASAAATDDTIDRLVARVEDRYLGEGKSWTRKTAGAPTTLAGLPAYAAEYEGATGRVRTLVARGRRAAFEIMFFAQPEDYAVLVGIFENLLASFRPAPDDTLAAPAPPSVSPPSRSAEPPTARPSLKASRTPPPTDQSPEEEEAPPIRKTPTGDSKMAAIRFQDPGFGFTIGYPAHWKRKLPSSNAVLFESVDPNGEATVSVQNVRSIAREPGTGPAVAVAENLKSRLSAEASDVTYMGDGPVTYRRDGLDLDGHQFLARYAFGGKVYKQLTVILVRPDGDIAHVWSYRALAPQFDDFRPITTEMLKSWSVIPPDTTKGEP